jgi:hypothetical protein
MAYNPRPTKDVLSGVGVTQVIPFNGIAYAGALQPTFAAAVSAGAALTYNVEVTLDDINAPGYNPATGIWLPFTGMSALTASALGTLGASIMGFRAHVTAWTSGTLTFQSCQPTAD